MMDSRPIGKIDAPPTWFRACRAARLLGGIVLVLATGATGCEKALFSDKMPRTQYEQYDRSHGAYVPATIRDRNGRERPALRERLQVPHG